MCDVVSMIKRCKVWNIARVDKDWVGRKVLFVVYVAEVLRWFKVHYKLAMVSEPQGAMRVASQIWQVVFASQTLPVFCFALRKNAQYVVVFQWLFFVLHIFMFHSNFCNSSFTMDTRELIVALGSLKLYKVFGKKTIQVHHFFHQCWAVFFLLCLQALFCTMSD